MITIIKYNDLDDGPALAPSQVREGGPHDDDVAGAEGHLDPLQEAVEVPI